MWFWAKWTSLSSPEAGLDLRSNQIPGDAWLVQPLWFSSDFTALMDSYLGLDQGTPLHLTYEPPEFKHSWKEIAWSLYLLKVFLEIGPGGTSSCLSSLLLHKPEKKGKKDKWKQQFLSSSLVFLQPLWSWRYLAKYSRLSSELCISLPLSPQG